MQNNRRTESQAKKTWNTPKLTVHGSLEQITQAGNKVGPNNDAYTAATGGAIVGSIVPL
ncbi:MAG: lasso peptide [Oscillochloris sp.]|nr:lasso peptide [Oscillochloris sp.]